MPTSNQIIQPEGNPVWFHELEPTLQDQYRSRHFEDFFYLETIYRWEQRREFLQPFQNSDSIRWQFQSQTAPLKYSLIDVEGRVWVENNMTDLLQNADDPAYRIYQADLSLAPYPEGVYFIKIECGAQNLDGTYPLVLISEPISIAQVQKDTLYLGYKGTNYYGSFVWATGFSPFIRLRATLRLKSPSSKDTFFEDDEMGMTLLQSKPYKVWLLNVGGPSGIPDYLATILNWVVGCKTLFIDGKQYTKNEGAKLEEASQANFPMRAWKIELRYAQNRSAKTYENNQVSSQGITIIATEDARGFGLNDGNSSEQIIEVH
jgi:hypothetical protein